ncbi:hypothetical protein [Xanthomonas citri]|uniref:hypothetical protein n=1 Tax=Xanthomonas citri TaxID=346 RepID=UPI000A2FDB5A|nr:hypothetical protein [Xanthomonas citri]ARR12449.1 hypothetical protein B7L66_09505 [Xanthomonas citri pv. citri]
MSNLLGLWGDSMLARPIEGRRFQWGRRADRFVREAVDVGGWEERQWIDALASADRCRGARSCAAL